MKPFRILADAFLVPLVFYAAFRWGGPEAGIALAVLATTVQWAWQATTSQGVSPFFALASGFTLVFGGIDLVADHPAFFRFQPSIQNAALCFAFFVPWAAGWPVLERFASALPEFARPAPDEVTEGYLRGLTGIWAMYFGLKSAGFAYLATKVDLASLVVWRTVLGGGSLVGMLGAELAYRKRLRPGLLQKRMRRAWLGESRDISTAKATPSLAK